MAVYTVHEPPMREESTPDPERFVFVRDGFSFTAFVFGPVWMLWHRMWLIFFGYVIVAGILEIALRGVGASSGATSLVGFLFALLIGFEAPTLRRFALRRRKWSNLGIIVGDNLESAEQRFFDAWTKSPGILPIGRTSATSHPRAQAEPPVIGLFPEPGGYR
jgi:Protein of unknown function (DUF2628)